jgi:hypothetical protein
MLKFIKMLTHNNRFLLVILGTLAALSSSGLRSQSVAPGEYWARCAAAMTQKALIIEEIEKRTASNLYPAIGHYYRLACAFSTPTATDIAYDRSRTSQMNAFTEAAKRCSVDSRCIVKFVEDLDGQLLICAGEQKRQATLIASVTRAVNEGCNVDIKP